MERRLRQQRRRSGLAVGLTMAAAVALFIVGATVIYSRLQPFVSDYVSLVTPVARVAAPTAVVASGSTGTEGGRVAGVQATPFPTEEPSTSPTPTPSAFTPDLQVNPAGTAVRLRAEPSTAGGEATIVDTLPPGTALQTTGQQESDPAQPGVTWLEVRTAAGQQGWMRQIDTVPVAP